MTAHSLTIERSTDTTATSLSCGQNGEFDPGKIETLEPTDPNFVTVD